MLVLLIYNVKIAGAPPVKPSNTWHRREDTEHIKTLNTLPGAVALFPEKLSFEKMSRQKFVSLNIRRNTARRSAMGKRRVSKAERDAPPSAPIYFSGHIDQTGRST